MRRLQDRVAIVTGGGDGIGRAVGHRFAADGAKVLVAELDEAAGETVAAQLRDEHQTDARSIRTLRQRSSRPAGWCSG